MRNRVIQIAQREIGYKEGKNNANKYSKDLYNKSQEWCADFVHWCLKQAGLESLFPDSSYVPTIANWYDSKKQYKNSLSFKGDYTPKTGDIILFDYNYNSTSDHIGLVEKVEGDKVYTIEGNKDNQVKRCVYTLSSRAIRAYCVLNYPTEVNKQEDKQINGQVAIIQKTINDRYGFNIVVDNLYGQQTKKALIKALQKEIGVVVDGIFGNQTKSHCPSLKNGSGGNIVYILQAILACKGYNLVVDGVFGNQTESIVRQFQKDVGIVVDGIAGGQTLGRLFE